MHSAQGYLIKSFRAKTFKRTETSRRKSTRAATPKTKRKKNAKKRDKKRENQIPLTRNWRIPGSRYRLQREPRLDLINEPIEDFQQFSVELNLFSNCQSSSSLKSLVSSKSSTLLSELEFYDYHEGRPFTSSIITKRIVSIKETKTSFQNDHIGDSFENPKSKLKFTGRGIMKADPSEVFGLNRPFDDLEMS